MLNFLRPSPILDEASIHWMFDSFDWALRNFDAEVFYNETILVNPSNKHFPGTEENATAMAKLIFNQTRDYAGLQHWPFQLLDENTLDSIEVPKISIQGPLRGSKGLATTDQSLQYVIPVNLALLRDPEVMIATYAHSLSHYLGTQAQQEPPGGVENWPHVTELLAVFLGFGLIMANTAYTHKIRSCGSCSGPAVERSNFLSQYDITYALAIFCQLKNISTADTLQFVKKSLRPFFKKAIKDVQSRKSSLESLSEHAPR